MGLREQKKIEMRERLADVAAALFAARGYDDVLVIDVARAAGVSEQTVYNYFPAKQDLVLDQAEEIRERYGVVVLDRPARTTPAGAIRPLVEADIALIEHGDLALAQGQFAAQCLLSPVLRRFALELREKQSATIAAAILSTGHRIPKLTALAHAAALVSVIQSTIDAIGGYVIATGNGTATKTPAEAAGDLLDDATAALDHLDESFWSL